MRKWLWLFLVVPLIAMADAPATARAPGRTLELQGAPNFRDIGGYVAGGGRHVRWGRVFRSGELSKLTPDDVAKVSGLGLAAVVDLRARDERDKSPSPWTRRPADIYESPKESLAPVMHSILRDAQTADGARAGIEEFYTRMPDDYRDEYAAVFHRVAAGELPLLVHCSAGKDRTGVAIAVLLAAVGVPRSTVVGDYALTEKLVPELPAPRPAVATALPQSSTVLAQLPEESRRALWRSDPAYLAAALGSIDREYGSVDEYVRRGLHIGDREMAAVRKALLD